ncbi:MAG TPA: hypothetical protein VFZ21_01850, partial [Gemmatimonadaceae bacterium]|nr:hypothetical protein [Gemmatimonadaceae bacterium]
MLRRMASAFPALEITLVDRTRGFFSYLVVASPAAEATLRRESWRAHRAPGTLVVAATDFFRLPEPDRRRIDRPNPPNFTPYTFGRSWPMVAGSAFIIDRDGTIVHAGELDRVHERQWSELIEILLSHPAAERRP